MTTKTTNRLLIVLMVVFTVLVGSLGAMTWDAAFASVTDFSQNESSGEYCLVSDVAAKVNALPDAESITVDNAASVIQMINDIDRIKYDMTGKQYDEFQALVETSRQGDVTRYMNAVEKINSLTDGAEFSISKNWEEGDDAYGGESSVTDTSEAEASFEITNVETGKTQTVTLFDLGASTSAFGADFYTKNSDGDGWTFKYILPAGTYTVKEINTDKPIVVNGHAYYFTCASISDGKTTETGADAQDGMTVTLTGGVAETLAITNKLTCNKFNENGFCSTHADNSGDMSQCENPSQPAEQDESGVYQIENAGNLFWFAALVNGTAKRYNEDSESYDSVEQELNANAKIVPLYIDLEGRNWTKIGANGAYAGTFDGNYAKIFGFVMTSTENVIGFFGRTSGATIKNFTLEGEITFDGEINDRDIGSIVGVASETLIQGIISRVDISAASTATPTSEGNNVTHLGGLVGDAGITTIKECAYYGTLNQSNGVEGTISCVGGIVGYGTYGKSLTIEDCGFYGEITGKAKTGVSTGLNANWFCGIVAYHNNGGKQAFTVNRCLFAGEITVENVGDNVANKVAFAFLYNGAATVTNCYSVKEDTTINATLANAQYENVVENVNDVSGEVMASGEIAYLLNNSADTGVWNQKLGTDAYPNFISTEKVYKVIASWTCDGNKEYVYSNDENSGVAETTCTKNFFVGDDGFVHCHDCDTLYKAYISKSALQDRRYDTGILYINGTLPEGYYIDEDGKTLTNGTEIINPYVLTASDVPVYYYRLGAAKYIVNGFDYTAPVSLGANDAVSLFEDWSNLNGAYFSHLDVSECTSLSRMFYGCSNMWLFSIETNGKSYFDTSNVTTMDSMFEHSGFGDTSFFKDFKLKDGVSLYRMFAGKSGISKISFEGFDLSKVGNMSQMFDCQWEEWAIFSEINFDCTISGSTVNVSGMFNSSYPIKLFDSNGCTIVFSEDMLSFFNAHPETNLNIQSDKLDYNGFLYEDGTYYASWEEIKQNGSAGTYTVHFHLNDGIYKYETEGNEIHGYCICGEKAVTYKIKDEDTLKGVCLTYTGEVLTMCAYEETVANTNIYTAGYSVKLTLQYRATENDEWINVDGYEVKEIGFYRLTLTVGTNSGANVNAVMPMDVTTAGDSAEISIEFQVGKQLNVTFKEYDGTNLGETQTFFGADAIRVPAITAQDTEYYTYTFKYWHCLELDRSYTTADLEALTANDFDTDKLTFVAVYYVTYKQDFELVGSLDEQTGLSEDSIIYDDSENVKIVSSDDEVLVYVNYEITANDGIAALLLIPEYNKTVFDIYAVSINGQLVFGSGASSNSIFTNGDGEYSWTVTVTGGFNNGADQVFKMLMEGLPASSATGASFIQIVYKMKNDGNGYESGSYDFGFVTKYEKTTDENAEGYGTSTDNGLSHSDRSEAYGVLTGNPNASMYELKISVTAANIIIVERKDAEIDVTVDEVVYDGAAAELYEDTLVGELTNVFVYCYSGFHVQLANNVTYDWGKHLTIKWYDADGNEIAQPTNAGSYKIGISATENDYFNALDEKIFNIEITPAIIDVEATTAVTKTYNGSDQTWNESDFTITYVDGKATINGEAGYSVELSNNTHKNAGIYTAVLTFTATANYAFENGTTKTINVEVEILKLDLTITAVDKTSMYGDTLVALEYTLSTTDANADLSFVGNDATLSISLTTKANKDAVGTYTITVTYEFVGSVENYTITLAGGTYTVTAKSIDLSKITAFTYNGTEQFPEVAAEFAGVYTFNGTAQTNAGSYTLTATLASDNYVWNDELGSSLDREIAWEIVALEITVTIGEYTIEYSDSWTINATANPGLIGGDTFESIGVVFTVNGSVDENGYYAVGSYTINGSYGGTNYDITFEDGSLTVNKKTLDDPTDPDNPDDPDNPQELLEELIAMIKGAVKEYTGQTITWANADFDLSAEINGVALSKIISITVVSGKADADYVNANVKLNDDGTFVYYVEGDAGKLYYVVTIELIDTANYTFTNNTESNLVDATEAELDIEVFIKQAKNDWTTTPTVSAPTVGNIEFNSAAKFKCRWQSYGCNQEFKRC